MKSSDLYNSLMEYSYFFNSRYKLMNDTVNQVAKTATDIKSAKLTNTDPMTFEFKTKGELSDDRITELLDYIEQKQLAEYPYHWNRTKDSFTVEFEVSWIPGDDSMPERHDPTVLSKALTRKVMAKMRSIQNREPSKYRGAGQAKCVSDYQDFKITFPVLDKESIKDYSSIISDIIEYNDGEVKSVNVEDDTTLRFKYEDNSEDITKESAALYESIEQQEEKYNDYLTKHIANVQKSFEDLLQIPEDRLPDILKDEETVVKLRNQLAKHDESKWSEEEYEPYRKHFYPDNDEEELSTEDFDKAWIHHHQNNPHHWQYWCQLDSEGNFELKPNIDEDVYKFYTVERVCDWCSCSRHFNNRVVDWYNENSAEIVQPENNIEFLLELLNLCNEFDIDKEK